MFKRESKPVELYDHTNAMGTGLVCMFSTPFTIWLCAAGAQALFSTWWITLLVTIISVPISYVLIHYYSSTWTRKEAEAWRRDQEWDSSR